jgi:OOP family OmpA-OmpF porin
MKKKLSKGSVAQITKLGLLALVLLLPQSARPAVREGSFEVSPFLGYNFFCPQQNLKDSLIYGGRISYNFSSHFGLEGTVDMVNTSVNDKTITGAVKGQFRSPTDKVDLFLYHLDAVFTFNPDDQLNFFAVGGFGGVNYGPSIESSDMSTFDLGLGAKYWLSENLALRLDLRDDMVTETFQGSSFLSNDYQNINATLGLVIAFGGEPEKKETVQAATPTPTAVVVYVAEEPKVEEKIAIIATPTDEEKTVVLAFEDVHFKFDKSSLSPAAKAIIKRTVQILKDNPKAHIRIAGYTSEAGTEDYNQRLSERRAEEVEFYLIKEGIVAKGRLTTIGYGEDRPAVHEAAPKNHYSKAAKANMRVLFEVIVK